jgi:hypothetical protein
MPDLPDLITGYDKSIDQVISELTSSHGPYDGFLNFSQGNIFYRVLMALMKLDPQTYHFHN